MPSEAPKTHGLWSTLDIESRMMQLTSGLSVLLH